jgi:hypothetical protein
MEEYRAYFVGRDGHFNGFEPLVCADDAAAIHMAKRLVNKFGIEIWNGVRLWFDCNPRASDGTSKAASVGYWPVSTQRNGPSSGEAETALEGLCRGVPRHNGETRKPRIRFKAPTEPWHGHAYR